MTSAEALRLFLTHIEFERRSPAATLAAYRSDLGSFLAWAAGQAPAASADVARVDRFVLRGWLGALSARQKPISVARNVTSARAWFRWLVRRGTLSTNPADLLKRPKGTPRGPALLSPEETRELVESAARLTPLELRDRALLEFLYSTGARATEASRLNLEDLALAQAEARVLGKGGKERIVYLGRPALASLRSWLAVRYRVVHRGTQRQDPRAVFVGVRGERLGRRCIHRLVKSYGRVATGRPGLYPHALRHAFATHLLHAGADLRSIQTMLGHARLSTTGGYAHVDLAQLCKVYDQAHPLAHRRAQGDVAKAG